MAQSRFKRIARIEPLGLQRDGRYATAMRGSIYNHDTGEERAEFLPTCFGATQEEADTRTQSMGKKWEKAGGT